MNRRYAIVMSIALVNAATAAERVVLPPQVIPVHYDVQIEPNVAGKSFSGSVKIDIQVAEAVRSITLNAAELKVRGATLDGAGAAPQVSYDEEHQTVTFKFPAAVNPGAHVLSVAYEGKINEQASGLFALQYDAAGGKKNALFTQFENADARRVIPCWDEPARKATFTLSAVVGADEMALSNMPAASSEPLPDGRKRVHFQMTPKMSSYLLFFAAGDFERVARNVQDVDVGVVVKRGETAKARFALDAAADLLAYYNDYFGIKYPLPKMDMVAAPGASTFFGAMENWGAILYFESVLLVDPKISTEGDRRGIFNVVAHEMAHQWFGDLVTMQWWEDLWLNEGFASWMAVKATDHFHPDWTPWLVSESTKDGAMRTDARDGTHPIVQPIRDVQQATQAFDEITYSKGEAVIRMLENFVGEDGFRDGVRAYIKKHAYGNSVSQDLWDELDKTSATRVSGIAHDFTQQAGVPLVQAAPNGDKIRLTQSRFSIDGVENNKTRWNVPVVLSAPHSAATRHVLSREQALDVPGAAGAVVNAGQAGYFRTLYAAPLLQPLAEQFAQLPPADQVGLINDASALGYSGYEPLSDFLTMAGKAHVGMDPLVLRNVVRRLQELDDFYDELPGQAALRAFGRRVLAPLLADTNWIARSNESPNIARLREVLLEALSQFDDAEVIAKARGYFADYLRDHSAITAELRRSVLGIVAMHADAQTWEQLHALAKAAPSGVEQLEMYELLGTARDPQLAHRALDLAVSEETVVTTRPMIIYNVAVQYPEMTFDFVNAHHDQVMATVESNSRASYLPILAANSHNEAMIPKLRAYAKARIPADAQQRVDKSAALIAYKAGVRKRRLSAVNGWLAANAV